MDSTGERVKYYIDLQGVSVKRFADDHGISYNNLSLVVKNDRPLGLNVLQQLKQAIPNLDSEWVLFGTKREDLYKNDDEALPQTAEPAAPYDLRNDPVKEMFLKYLDAPEVQEKIKLIINPPRKAKQTNKIIKSRILDDRDLAFALGLDPSTFEDLDVDPVLEQQINEALNRDNIELAVSLIKEALAHKNVSHEKK